MKLYVWVDPYHIDYGSTLVIAIADNLKEAREQAKVGQAYAYGEFKKDTPSVVLGKPTRVVGIPCAEWHYWQE